MKVQKGYNDVKVHHEAIQCYEFAIAKPYFLPNVAALPRPAPSLSKVLVNACKQTRKNRIGLFSAQAGLDH